jgi:hypothetical protein
MNTIDVTQVIPQLITAALEHVRRSEKLNMGLAPGSPPLSNDSNIILAMYNALATISGVPVENSIYYTNSKQYMQWLSDMSRMIRSIRKVFETSYSEMSYAIGNTPIDSSTSVAATVARNAASATEMLRKVTNGTNFYLAGDYTSFATSESARLAVDLHLQALQFVKHFQMNPVFSPSNITSSPLPSVHGGIRAIPRYRFSNPNPGDPYTGWLSGQPPTVTPVVDADQAYGYGKFVAAGAGDATGVNITIPVGMFVMAKICVECDLPGTVTCNVGPLNSPLGYTRYDIPLESYDDVNVGCAIIPFPQIEGSFSIAGWSTPSGSQGLRVSYEFTDLPIYNDEVIVYKPDCTPVTVQAGLPFSSVFAAINGCSDNPLAWGSSLSRVFVEARGYDAIKTVLNVFTSTFATSREYSSLYTGVNADYVDPANWDLFVRPNVDRIRAAKDLLTMSENDISVSLGYLLVSDDYASAFLSSA